MTTAVQTQSEYRNLPLVSLTESATNPRRSFDQTALSELAESIKTQGILAPLVVRPVGQHFEIVAGARRYRAAQLAGLETVPVRIVELTDAQALEASIVENLQRRDVHPLEEAQGFAALLNLKSRSTASSKLPRRWASPRHIVARPIEIDRACPRSGRGILRKTRSAWAMRFCWRNCNPRSRNRPSPLASGGMTRTAARPSASCSRFGICSSGLSTTFCLILKHAPFRKRMPQLVPEAGAASIAPSAPDTTSCSLPTSRQAGRL